MERVYIDSDEMKERGIKILTGEACALSMRLLCEVSRDVMQDYIEYTGIPVNIDSIPTSCYNDRDAYSVYLTRDSIKNLIIFQLVREYELVNEILTLNGSLDFLLCGNRDDIRNHLDEYREVYGYIDNDFKYHDGDSYKVGRGYSLGTHPRRGMGNIHAMTGVSK